MNANLAAVFYLVAGVLFILALRGLSSPATSRQGNFFGMIGMAIAIATTLAAHPPADGIAWLLVVLGVAIGGSIGAVIARRVPMTSMPELVAAGAFYAPEAFDIGTPGHIHGASLIEMSLGVAIGALTFTGSVIVVGALLAVGVPMISSGSGWARGFGFIALIFACVNIFGGFLVTQRMLAMYKKKVK